MGQLFSKIDDFCSINSRTASLFTFLTNPYPGGIRSHDPLLPSPRWHAETIPLDPAARGPFLTSPLRANIDPPPVTKLFSWGELCPLGVKLSLGGNPLFAHRSSKAYPWVPSSPLGDKFHRGSNSPLGANFTPGGKLILLKTGLSI
jgi:hypothetical protein